MHFNFLIIILLFETSESQILGGRDAKENTAHQVFIEAKSVDNSYATCGGAIISKDFVLTAAHCVEDYDKREIKVGSGNIDDRKLNFVSIDEKFVHPGYQNIITTITWTGKKEIIGANDIALLKVAVPFIFDENHQPIGLFTTGEKVKEGWEVTIYGWGVSGMEPDTAGMPSKKYSNILQEIKTSIIKQSECQKYFKEILYKTQKCVKYLGTDGVRDACVGDSGAAIVYEKRIIGVISWGKSFPECGFNNFPTIFTDISHYYEWIDGFVQTFKDAK